MCIRDSFLGVPGDVRATPPDGIVAEFLAVRVLHGREEHEDCLLYTSDAADERSSVDLGGRRIIKKKNKSEHQHLRDRHEKSDKPIHNKRNTRYLVKKPRHTRDR